VKNFTFNQTKTKGAKIKANKIAGKAGVRMPGHQRTKITIQNGKPKSNRKWGKTSAHNSTAKRKIQRQRQGVK